MPQMLITCACFWLIIILATAYAYTSSRTDNQWLSLFAWTCPFWSLPVAIVMTEGAAKLLGV